MPITDLNQYRLSHRDKRELEPFSIQALFIFRILHTIRRKKFPLKLSS